MWRQIVSFLPSSSCLPLSLLFSLFSSLLSKSFLSLYSFIIIKFLGRCRRKFFYSGNFLCYLKVAKEKLEKLSMVLGVGELYNFYATSIYEHMTGTWPIGLFHQSSSFLQRYSIQNLHLEI